MEDRYGILYKKRRRGSSYAKTPLLLVTTLRVVTHRRLKQVHSPRIAGPEVNNPGYGAFGLPEDSVIISSVPGEISSRRSIPPAAIGEATRNCSRGR